MMVCKVLQDGSLFDAAALILPLKISFQNSKELVDYRLNYHLALVFQLKHQHLILF